MRIIKRYANRRLYDTETSSYITLEEVEALVLKQIKFKVIDNQTDEDMTTYVLLQIISEHENKQFPIFTPEVLENIIRLYGNPLQKNMSEFLDQFFTQFGEQKNNPLEVMTELTKRNMELWQSSFSSYFSQQKEGKAKGKSE